MSASQRDQWLIETTRETEPVPHSPIKRVQHSSTATWTPHRFPTFPTNLVGIGNYCGISRGSISSHNMVFENPWSIQKATCGPEWPSMSAQVKPRCHF